MNCAREPCVPGLADRPCAARQARSASYHEGLWWLKLPGLDRSQDRRPVSASGLCGFGKTERHVCVSVMIAACAPCASAVSNPLTLHPSTTRTQGARHEMQQRAQDAHRQARGEPCTGWARGPPGYSRRRPRAVNAAGVLSHSDRYHENNVGTTEPETILQSRRRLACACRCRDREITGGEISAMPIEPLGVAAGESCVGG